MRLYFFFICRKLPENDREHTFKETDSIYHFKKFLLLLCPLMSAEAAFYNNFDV